MDCIQCQATTSSGSRCKLRTCRQYPYCWIHLKKIDGLQVKTSQIPNAGKGLYYVGKKPIKKDKKIATYSARQVSRHPDETSDYNLEVGRGRYLNSTSPLNYVGRYINDSRNTAFRNNVRLTKSAQIKMKNNRYTVPIYTTKKINPKAGGVELFLPYGRGYWTA